MKFRDMPQFPFASYRCDIGWDYLEPWLRSHDDAGDLYTLEIDPEYQRGYVWTEYQKTAYVEYQLRGGFSGKDIFWNCPNWHSRGTTPNAKLELVDGKQRIDAVRDFLNDKVTAFGLYHNEFEGSLSFEPRLTFHINNMANRKNVVEWYLGLNTGGSVHTEKDLQPAIDLLRRLENA